MGSDSILAGIGATVLAVTLLVCGFAACCLPVTTASLAGAVSTGADSPYTHEQLVSLAQETRAFTVDAHSSMEEARESLAADVVAAAREASAEGAPKYSQWTQQAKQVLGDAEGEGGAVAADDGAAAGDGSALETMDALAKVSDRYALDADAVSHLEDCNGLITGLSSYLGMIGVAALIIALVLGFRKQFAALAFMLRMGPALLLAVLVVLGLWGVIDSNGLFAAFHSLFFVDGTWTFNYDSLLISMYPIDFWMGMGAVWVGSAIGVGLLCFAAGCLFAWKAQVQHRELEEAAAGRRRPLQEAPQEGPSLMARAPKDHKTNALRELDAAGAGLRHEELFFDAEPTMTGEEIRALAGGGSRRRLQDPRHPGQVRRLLRVPRARGRRARPEEGGRGGRREGHRRDQGPRASAAHRLCARRLLAHRHEEALSHLRG